MWLFFIAIVIFLLILDLGVLHKKQREIGVRESLFLSAGYIIIACIFGGWIWSELGAQNGKEFFTAYLVEKSLSMDNVFVISLIFGFLAIPRVYQHRVLFWGILGVIVLRAIMIGLGAILVSKFSWVMFIFAGFLIVTGVKMLFMKEQGQDLENNVLLKWLRSHIKITKELHGNKFTLKLPDESNPSKKVRWFTPLFVALVMIEFADLIFAVDSVPAVFAITTDPYIVYTSNIFAILGLRALYFALDAIIARFAYLKYALALILVFIGGKVFIAHFMGMEKFPASISLSVTFGLLAAGILFSLYKTRNGKKEA